MADFFYDAVEIKVTSKLAEMEERLDPLDHPDGLGLRQTDRKKAQSDSMLCHRKIVARDQAAKEVIAEIKALHSDISSKAKTDIALATEMVERAEALATDARRELEVKRTKWEAKESLVQRLIDFLNDGQPFPPTATEMNQMP